MGILSSYKNPKTFVKESSIEGKGRFTSEDIKKGEIITIKAGHIVHKDDLDKFREVIKHSEMQIADEFYVIPTSEQETENIITYLNHSCDPNIGIEGNVIVVAMRDIKSGEELCLDYAMIYNHDSSFECNCGSNVCRRTVKGSDWQIKELQEKYGDYFSSYLLKKINNS